MSTTQRNYESMKNKLGEESGVSDWILIDQAMIDQFAQVTQDLQFIHVDPKRAKEETDFGGTIAHGFLVLSMASKFALDVFPRESEKKRAYQLWI
jgi:acyl dehydratase